MIQKISADTCTLPSYWRQERMAKKEEISSFTFNYLKSSNFRVIHVDGAIGGLTPGGFVHMTVYSERVAIPKKVVHEVREDGSLGEEIKRESLNGVVREMEADLIFNIDEAIALRDWLDNQVKKAQERLEKGN
jgi:hypothetical protein